MGDPAVLLERRLTALEVTSVGTSLKEIEKTIKITDAFSMIIKYLYM